MWNDLHGKWPYGGVESIMTPSSLLITELYLFSVSVWLVIEVQIGWSYGGVDNSMTSLSLPIITDSLNLTPEVPTAHVALTHQYSNPGKLSPELSSQSS